jgi:hypothetical protein
MTFFVNADTARGYPIVFDALLSKRNIFQPDLTALWHYSNVRGADCDTGHYIVGCGFRESLS